MRRRTLSHTLIELLVAHERKCFADAADWRAHLERLGIAALKVQPVKIATEGALWGSVVAHGLAHATP